MNYLSFLTDIIGFLTGATVGGNTLNWYSEICLEDEIELKTGTTYPAIFVVPIPFDITDDMMAKYGCKIYLVDNITRAPNYNLNRINIYNKMINYAMAFIQQLPDNYINDFPLTINPIVRWDANVDGIYFDFTLNYAVPCL